MSEHIRVGDSEKNSKVYACVCARCAANDGNREFRIAKGPRPDVLTYLRKFNSGHMSPGSGTADIRTPQPAGVRTLEFPTGDTE